MKSPFGSRGSICAHFGWSWHYLHWGIRWQIVQRMMVDAPSFDSSSDDESEKKKEEPALELTPERAAAFAARNGGIMITEPVDSSLKDL